MISLDVVGLVHKCDRCAERHEKKIHWVNELLFGIL